MSPYWKAPQQILSGLFRICCPQFDIQTDSLRLPRIVSPVLYKIPKKRETCVLFVAAMRRTRHGAPLRPCAYHLFESTPIVLFGR